VKGSPALAFLQWLGRSNVLFLVLHSVPEVRRAQRLQPCVSQAPARACVATPQRCPHQRAPSHAGSPHLTARLPRAAVDALGGAGHVHMLGAGRRRAIPLVRPLQGARPPRPASRARLMTPCGWQVCTVARGPPAGAADLAQARATLAAPASLAGSVCILLLRLWWRTLWLRTAQSSKRALQPHHKQRARAGAA